jgi:hypothetical protein
MIAIERRQRRRIGNPKSGLVLRVHQAPEALRLSTRPDPLLLYVVLGTAAAVGIIWAVASSFHVSWLGLLVFVALFSPVICLLVLHTVRIRATCVLDRERGTLEIDEQSYTRRLHQSYPLRDVEAIAVRMLHSGPLLGTASTFGLFMLMPQIEYLAAASNNESSLSQDAWRVSRFLGVSLETPMGQEQSGQHGVPIGLMLVTIALYLVPTLLTISSLILLFERLPNVQPSVLALLGAIIVSQFGAILAFAYYRARRPYDT